MNYKILTLQDTKEWNELITRLPEDQQDIYYTPEYYSLYENYGDGKAQCFVFEKNGKLALYPFLINSVNAIGYNLDNEYFDIQGTYGYNGVISSNYNEEFINNFYREFYKYCSENNIIAEFTRFNPYLKNRNFSKNHLQVILNRKTIVLDINDSIDHIWANSFSSKNRNMIRKALKKDYSFSIDNSNRGAIDFYNIYLKTMKRIGADSYYYFNETMFLQMIKNPAFQFLFIVDKANKRVAAMILMVSDKYAHYHLSGRNIKKADNSVNNYLLYEAVRLAQEKGVEVFHFGGGNSLDKNDSLFKFKSNFSKDHLDFYIGKKIHNQEIYDKVIKQWKIKNPKFNKYSKDFLLKYRQM